MVSDLCERHGLAWGQGGSLASWQVWVPCAPLLKGGAEASASIPRQVCCAVLCQRGEPGRPWCPTGLQAARRKYPSRNPDTDYGLLWLTLVGPARPVFLPHSVSGAPGGPPPKAQFKTLIPQASHFTRREREQPRASGVSLEPKSSLVRS
jgi:hypothetical protein